MGTNIVLCFDGTGDWAATDTTNVMKMFERMDQVDQTVYYDGGVGTLGSPLQMSKAQQIYARLLDLATAKTIGQKVLSGYSFLVEHYADANPDKGEEGDKIYLFGFSRGAYTARLVAAMIHNFGLVKKEHANLAPYLWQTMSSFRTIQDFWNECETIRNDFARGIAVKVHFMGLFDTVSSVGIFSRFNVYPYTDKNPSVEHIRHAVSINEQCNCFPELLITPAKNEAGQLNDVKEIWFPGVHRDIGGGAFPAGLSNQTLVWMMNEARPLGLQINVTPPAQESKQVHYGGLDPYVFVGLYPMKMFDPMLHLSKRHSSNWGYAAVRNRIIRAKTPKKFADDKTPADPGFRFFWPNLKHVRRIPENAYVYLNETDVLYGGHAVPIGTVKNDGPAKYEALGPNPRDTVGTFLGVTLAGLVANAFLGSPLQRLFEHFGHSAGVSWPGLSGTLTFWLFLAFLIQQGYSQVTALKASTAWINKATPLVLCLSAAAIAVGTGPWMTLYFSLGLAVLAVSLSELGGKPILPAVRAIAYFMVPWLLIAIVRWLAIWVLGHLWIYVLIFLSWLFVPRHDWWFSFEPWLDIICWIAAIVTMVIGLANIVQDRKKMEPPQV